MKKTIKFCFMLAIIPATMFVSCKKDDTTTATTTTPTSKPSLYDTLGVFLETNGPSTGTLGNAVTAGAGAKINSASGRPFGEDAIAATVDQFLTNVLGDAKINGRFTNANAKALRLNLIDQICAATGGGCVYKGLDMKTAHSSKNTDTKAAVTMITADEFDALVGDLVKAMTSLKIPSGVQGSIAGFLLPMKSQIINNN